MESCILGRLMEAQTVPSIPKQLHLALLACVLAVVGALGPWVDAFGIISANGHQMADGWIAAAFAGTAGLALFLAPLWERNVPVARWVSTPALVVVLTLGSTIVLGLRWLAVDDTVLLAWGLPVGTVASGLACACAAFVVGRARALQVVRLAILATVAILDLAMVRSFLFSMEWVGGGLTSFLGVVVLGAVLGLVNVAVARWDPPLLPTLANGGVQVAPEPREPFPVVERAPDGNVDP